MGCNKRYKRLSGLTLAELACNRCVDEILDMQELLRLSIRLHFSRLLHNIDYENRKVCRIGIIRPDWVGSVGSSVILTSVWQDQVEGFILFCDDINRNKRYELDEFSIEDQISILLSLSRADV